MYENVKNFLYFKIAHIIKYIVIVMIVFGEEKANLTTKFIH